MEKCKAFERGDHEEYSKYVFGYLLPYFDELNSKKASKKGCKKIIAYGKDFQYQGDLDSKGRANGYGFVVSDWLTYEGTFVNDRFEGIGESFLKQITRHIILGIETQKKTGEVWQGEWLNGLKHGKLTYKNMQQVTFRQL